MKKKWMEWVALAAVMNYCLFLFLSASTTFRVAFSEGYRVFTWCFLVGVGTVRLGFGVVTTGRGGTVPVSRWALFGVLLSLVPCCIVANRFGYKFLVYIPFVAMCLYGMKPEKVLKVFGVCIGVALGVTVLCALSGAIRNLIYPGYGRKGRIRAAYGTNYPTDFASYIAYLVLISWCVRKRRGRAYTALHCCIALAAAYMVYVYPHSETSTICCAVTAAVILYIEVMERKGQGDGSSGPAHAVTRGTVPLAPLVTATDWLATWAFPILFVCLWGLVILYGQGFGIAEKINGMLSDRLNLVWTAFQKYGIQAFGALTPQKGWGGGLIHSEAYEFLDSTYALLPIRYGWVLTIGAGAAWVWMTRKAIRTGHRRIGYAMAIIALHSFSEHHFPEMNYNLLLAMPLCAFAGTGERAADGAAEKVRIRQWIAWAAGIAVALLLLPAALSWARCLIAVKGWSGGGEPSLKAAVFWLGGGAMVVMLVFCVKQVVQRRGQGDGSSGSACAIPQEPSPWSPWATGIFIVGCLLLAVVLGVNEEISAAGTARAAQMEAERTAIEDVLAAAREPVYAGQEEELYKRKYGRIAGRIFSPEELARSCKGSILLEHDNDGYPLIYTGALYTELSPETGLFTYDEALAGEMRGKGYVFTPYYSAERTYTGLMDQYGGDYVVTFTLELTDIAGESDGNPAVCDLKVYALWGRELLAERTLYEEDFGGNGLVAAEVAYSTGDVRMVSYEVEVREGAGVATERIDWKRKPERE